MKAVRTPYPAYEEIGVKVDGEYRQLNDTILQIENEHYSDVRPKRVARHGERPLQALRSCGVEYVEIRNTDVNPFLPAGIDTEQVLFFDAFLISCLLMEETLLSPEECRIVQANMQKVINRGREPGLMLEGCRGERSLVEIGGELLDLMLTTGELLDEVHDTNRYSEAVRAQLPKLEDPSQTPSARVLAALREMGLDYDQWILLKSREHKETFARVSPKNEIFRELQRRADESVVEQRELEAGDVLDFDEFLAEYLDIAE